MNTRHRLDALHNHVSTVVYWLLSIITLVLLIVMLAREAQGAAIDPLYRFMTTSLLLTAMVARTITPLRDLPYRTVAVATCISIDALIVSSILGSITMMRASH